MLEFMDRLRNLGWTEIEPTRYAYRFSKGRFIAVVSFVSGCYILGFYNGEWRRYKVKGERDAKARGGSN